MIAAKNHKNGVGNPYAQLRKDLGFEFCRNAEREESVRRRPAQAHRLLARLRRRRGAGAGRRRDRAADRTRRSRSAPTAHVSDFLPMSKRDILKFEGCTRGLEARARQRRHRARRSFVRRDARLLHHRRTDRIRGDGARAGRAGRARDAGRLDAEGRQAAGQSVRRAEGQGPPDRRHRRVDARALRHAACRHAPATSRCTNAKLAGIFNMGGAAVANYVSVLERIK